MSQDLQCYDSTSLATGFQVFSYFELCTTFNCNTTNLVCSWTGKVLEHQLPTVMCFWFFKCTKMVFKGQLGIWEDDLFSLLFHFNKYLKTVIVTTDHIGYSVHQFTIFGLTGDRNTRHCQQKSPTFNFDDFSTSLPFDPGSVCQLISKEWYDQHWDSVIQAFLNTHHASLSDEQPGVIVAE